MKRSAVGLLLVLAIIRFGHVAYTGLTHSIGDFYSTLPGAYVETFNPTLWNSPDLVDEVGKRPSYRRGPTQLLTTLPLSFLDSYREIALVLLVLYGVLIPASAFVMWRTFSGSPRDTTLLALVVASSLVFYPTLLAYTAREFEVLLLFATVLLFAAARAGRQWMVGAWTAYLALFKYLPLGLLPLLIARRWWKALGGFAITAAVMLAAAHAMFGLQNFSSDGFLGNFIAHLLPGQSDTFCSAYKGWYYESNQHEVSIRFALCSMRENVALPIVPIYLALIVATLSALAVGYFRAERAAPLTADAERWRITWELSAVMIVYMTYVYSHYYFLIFLIVPLTALMIRAYEQRRTGLWLAWGASYVMLSGFLLPLSLVSRLLQVDAFTWYLQTFAYVPGILLLLGTVLREYIRTAPSLSS
jgi:Glycosyltransferase family 87